MARLPRSVIALGLVSFFTDASSEMIYPLLPVFVTALGAGPQFLGIIEGVAETTSALLKLVSGRLSDRWGVRRPFVLAGYGLSGFTRPLMGIATLPVQVLGIRFLDRVGKGLRTSPRDVMIADAVSAANRGRAFGFHRAMDHTGAVVGPLLATLAFALMGSDENDLAAMRRVFLWSLVPAILAMLVILFFVRESRTKPADAAARASVLPAKGQRVPLSYRMKQYLAAIFVLDLSLSSDAFILLRAAELGIAATSIPLLWSAHHVVKALFSTPGGALSDRIGRRGTLLGGYVIYALVYVGFAFASQAWHAWALMILYGGFFALTEGTEKALVADLSSQAEAGTAFGAYHLVSGLAALPASLIFGYLWTAGGSQMAFLAGAAIAMTGIVLLNLVLIGAKKPSAT